MNAFTKRLSAICFMFIISGALLSCGATILKSDGCDIGYQKAPAGNCVRNLSCLETDGCFIEGKCTYAHGVCVATTERDCQASENCHRLGECRFEVDPQCRPIGICVASPDGCAASQICRTLGKCTPGKGRFCVVGGDDDCRQSIVCQEDGRCTATRVVQDDGRTSRIQACQ